MFKWLISFLVLFTSILSYADLNCSSQIIKNVNVQQQCKKINKITQDAQSNYQEKFFAERLRESLAFTSYPNTSNNTSVTNNPTVNQQNNAQTNNSTAPDVDSTPANNTTNTNQTSSDNGANIKYY